MRVAGSVSAKEAVKVRYEKLQSVDGLWNVHCAHCRSGPPFDDERAFPLN